MLILSKKCHISANETVRRHILGTKDKKRAKKALNRSPEKFRGNWPFGSAEEVQNSFPDGGCGSHLGILIKTSSAYFFFLYKSTRYSLPIFQSTGLLVQEIKLNLQDGSHLGFLIEMILPDTKFRVSWPLGSKEEVKNRF